jgi:FG-GAP repeat
MYGQSGFSVHVTDDNEEILIGCPGILNWKGSVIRHRKQKSLKTHGMSKRDVTSSTDLFDEDIPSPFHAPASITEDSYFGYAVSSATFLGKKNDKSLFYVASAPQANNQQGLVYIFNITIENDSEKVNVLKEFSGLQFGEYFGYTLLTEDFNNDGLPDVAISGPLYSKNKVHDNGAVYIFINRGNVSIKYHKQINVV